MRIKTMETIHFDIKPQNFIRTLIQMIYEENINQYKEVDNLDNLKYATFDFLFSDNHLSNEYIDKICSEMTDDDTLKIENTNEFRYNLWKALINSEEYINHISNRNILNDKKQLVNDYQKKYWIETN